MFRWYAVTERGAAVAPLPKSLLRFAAILLLGTGAFLVAGSLGDSWLLGIGLFLVSLLCAVDAEWEARSTIEFTKEGVLLRNGWRTKMITWSRFDRFAVPIPKYGFHVGRILTTDGDSIRSQLLTPWPQLGRGEKSVERAVAALNDAAAQARLAMPSEGHRSARTDPCSRSGMLLRVEVRRRSVTGVTRPCSACPT